MCSFLGTNRKTSRLDSVNYFQQFRGPDVTNVYSHGNATLVHNLLSITGQVTPQPFVKNGVAIIFNGEIYNHSEFGKFDSDGEALIPAYEKFGYSYAEHLDGEFAIAIIDHDRDVLVLSTDTFGTKPLWFAFENGTYGVSSYKSSLDKLNFSAPSRFPSNATRVYSLKDLSLLEEHAVHTFDLRQHKNNYSDFIRAFQESVKKRSLGVTKKIFLGLSSGYDSGAIACELEKQNVEFKVFSIEGGENKEIIDARLHHHKYAEKFELTIQDFITAKHHLKKYSEDVFMSILPERGRGGYVSDNTGAVGLSEICRRARDEGYRVLFSGQGADEIFSDYGFNGKKYAKHSSFGGKFPEKLESVFPWRNFFEGTQRAYLDKEEYVAGSWGIETRYPFLDTAVVQEFLSLTPECKNAFYKAPLHEYLKQNSYPFLENEKAGFSPASYSLGEKLTVRSIAFRLYWIFLRYKRHFFGV
jgi:asparagine synthetase B (glutamine-hydrolysing)